MSRMTKFLKQTCLVEKLQMKNGKPVINDFGEFQYQEAVSAKCRHEQSHRDVQTANGSIVRSTSVYYLDEHLPIAADDRVDGKVVISVSEYINGLGRTEGYEVYV